VSCPKTLRRLAGDDLREARRLADAGAEESAAARLELAERHLADAGRLEREAQLAGSGCPDCATE